MRDFPPSEETGESDKGRLRDWYSNLGGFHKLALWLFTFVCLFPTIVGVVLSPVAGEFLYVAPLFDVWWWRPIWHDFVYSLIASPTFVIYGTISVVLTALTHRYTVNIRRARSNEIEADASAVKTKAVVLGALTVLSVILLLVGLFITGIAANETYAKQTMAEMETQESIPHMSDEHPRYQTRGVAKKNAQNLLRSNTMKVGGTDDITFLSDGSGAPRPHWSYPYTGDTLPKKLLGSQEGVIYVPMDTQSTEDVKMVTNQTMKCGMGVSLTDNHEWQLYKDVPATQVSSNAFNVPHKGENYIAHMMKGLEFHTVWGIYPYTIEKYRGVRLIDSDCNIKHVAPSEVSDHTVLKDQNVYPYGLTLKRVKSLRWKNGFVAKEIHHTTDFQISDTAEDGNSQPFLVQTESGDAKYIVAAEPYGRDTNGVYRLYIADGQTGEMTKVTLGRDESVVGPEAAAGYVPQAIPKILGSSNEGQYDMSEAIPTTVNGEFFWMFRVVSTGDSTGITRIVYVDGSSPDSNTQAFKDTSEATEFLRTGDAQTTSNQTSSQGRSGDDDDGVTIIVAEDTDGDGEPDKTVRKFTVSENQSIIIQPNEQTNSTDDK